MVVARVNVHFSILDEYERRMNETLLPGFGTGFPGKFENVRPLRCNSKHSEMFLPTLYTLDLYISMIYLYISINYFDMNSESSIICAF